MRVCVCVCVCVCLCVLCVWMLSRHVVECPKSATLHFKEFACVEKYCAPCFHFVSLWLYLFGRDPYRTSGQLEAVLTRLQTISQPSRGLFGIVALSLFCVAW